MPHVTFIALGQAEIVLSAADGISLMEAAVQNDVQGIDADCGGACTCATCHVYVAEDWLAALPPPRRDEAEMLEFAIDPRPTSRLSCQISIGAALDGLTVEIPPRQR